MPFLKMVKFQLKLYIKNSYFVNLVIIETSSMLLYEYLAGYVDHNYSGQEWLIAGIMGTWSSCTTSAGALGYQRRQGTLSHLLNTAIPHEEALLTVLSPAAIYGLIAFPLAGIETIILKMPLNNLSWQLLLGVFLLWIACIILSYFISLFFILSRNAIAYEQLIFLPILLLSGLLSVPNFIYPFIKPFQLLSPLSLPIKIIYGQFPQFTWILSYIAVLITFILLSKWMTNIVIQRAFKERRLNIF